MTIQQFIEKAIEGGWHSDKVLTLYAENEGVVLTNEETGATHVPTVAEIMLDREAWKAVGKVGGWPENEEGYQTHRNGLHSDDRPYAGEPECDCDRPKTWKFYMHRMIDALAERETVEEYLKTL